MWIFNLSKPIYQSEQLFSYPGCGRNQFKWKEESASHPFFFLHPFPHCPSVSSPSGLCCSWWGRKGSRAGLRKKRLWVVGDEEGEKRMEEETSMWKVVEGGEGSKIWRVKCRIKIVEKGGRRGKIVRRECRTVKGGEEYWILRRMERGKTVSGGGLEGVKENIGYWDGIIWMVGDGNKY